MAERRACLAGAREKLDYGHPFVRRDGTHTCVKFKGIHVSLWTPGSRGFRENNGKQYLISLVKLAYGILEDELHSSVLTRAPQYRTN